MRAFTLVAGLAGLSLTGCVVAPARPAYYAPQPQAYYAPPQAYYAPPPAYYAPPPVVVLRPPAPRPLYYGRPYGYSHGGWGRGGYR